MKRHKTSALIGPSYAVARRRALNLGDPEEIDPGATGKRTARNAAIGGGALGAITGAAGGASTAGRRGLLPGAIAGALGTAGIGAAALGIPAYLGARSAQRALRADPDAGEKDRGGRAALVGAGLGLLTPSPATIAQNIALSAGASYAADRLTESVPYYAEKKSSAAVAALFPILTSL